MRSLFFVISLWLAMPAVIFAREHCAELPVVNGVSITMEGDILTATSDNSNDRIDKIWIYDATNDVVAKKTCGMVMQCQMNLSALSPGTYLAKVFTEGTFYQQYIVVS